MREAKVCVQRIRKARIIITCAENYEESMDTKMSILWEIPVKRKNLASRRHDAAVTLRGALLSNLMIATSCETYILAEA